MRIYSHQFIIYDEFLGQIPKISRLRYNVPPVEAVELLSRTLYQSSPYEYSHKDGGTLW